MRYLNKSAGQEEANSVEGEVEDKGNGIIGAKSEVGGGEGSG